MKKILALISPLLITVISLQAQTIYEFSFAYPNGENPVGYKALFIDHHDGTGKARLKFASPTPADTILVDLDVKEEMNEISGCNNGNWIYYKLQNPRFIENKDPGITLPGYLCFKKETASGLFSPAGIAYTADCKTDPIKFSSVSGVDKTGLTKEFILNYFKPYEPFYRSQFVTNNSKALTTAEQNTKLYLLFVANVTDTEIGAADRKNMNEAIVFFKKIKDFLGIGAFIYDTVTGVNFNKETVLTKIKSFLTPGPNDIVVFYYSGHGFRQPTDGRPGPYIDMRDLVIDKRKKYLEQALSMEDIVAMIRSKGARLNLVLSDCCNDNVTSTNPMAKEPPLAGKKGGFGMNWSTQNCRDLFLNAMPTTILATAASPFQLAISNEEFGGYFSTFFRNTLELNLGFTKTNVKWDAVFEQTKQQTETKSGRTWCNEAKTIKCNRQQPYVSIRYGRF